jgi:NAD(P)-dependent dehydrogenase (short-subunit alcohol dehydrogenase family)
VELSGAGVLIVGGASGLGAATVKRLTSAGAVVTVADINRERGQELATATGAAFLECDVRDEDAVERTVKNAAQQARTKGLRLAVTCAGMGMARKIASRTLGPHPLKDFLRVSELNMVGTFNVMRFAATAMLENQPTEDGERGLLINTASVAAFEGQAGQIAYSASKGAIVSMTLTAARDLAKEGIRVMTIAPGVFDTPILGRLSDEQKAAFAAQTPFPNRLGQPNEYAALVQAIAENPMLNGATIRIDGGLRMPPR